MTKDQEQLINRLLNLTDEHPFTENIFVNRRDLIQICQLAELQTTKTICPICSEVNLLSSIEGNYID